MPTDTLPAEVGSRCWACRLYTTACPEVQTYDSTTRSLRFSPPPLWLVCWTIDVIEAAFSAAQRSNEVDLDTFHTARQVEA